MREPYPMPSGQSVVFDAARILATLAVFIGHATRPDVLSDMDVSLIGRATIPVFLMISAAAMLLGVVNLFGIEGAAQAAAAALVN